MRKKILFITGRKLLPTNSGDKILSNNTIKALSEKFDVFLLSISNEGDYSQNEQTELYNFVKDATTIKERINIVPVALALSFILNKSSLLTQRAKRNSIKKRVQDKIQEINPDIVFWDHLRSSAYYVINNRTNILLEHNNESQIMLQNREKEKNWIKKSIYHFLYKKLRKYECQIHSKMSKIIYISEIDLRNRPNAVLLKQLPIKFKHTIYHIKQKYNCNLLFIGSMDWHPNITGIKWFIKDVFPKLNGNTTLNIVGRNIPVSISNLGNDRIKFHSTVPDVESYYLEADILISPIISGGGVNIKILEALSYGIPIAPTSFSLRGYTGLNFLAPQDEAIELAKRINFLAENLDARIQISEQEKTYYQNYIRDSVKNLIAIIEN